MPRIADVYVAVDPIPHFRQPQLRLVDDSPWLGLTVRGPHRSRSTVERVYSTPFGADVALCRHQEGTRGALRLEVTDMLSTPERPAVHRTEYLRNYRRLLNLHGTVNKEKATKQTHQAIARRSAFYERFQHAKVYVEAALLESIQIGDHVVNSHGIQMIVTDPDVRRDLPWGWGWRTHMQVELTPEFERFAHIWNWEDGQSTWFIHHEGWGLLPTLGLV